MATEKKIWGRALQAPRYCLLVRQHMAQEFWQGELDSALILVGHQQGLNDADLTYAPFVLLSESVSREQAIEAGERCVQVKKILEVWAIGNDTAILKEGFRNCGFRPYPFPSCVGDKNHGFPVDVFGEMCIDLPERKNNEPVSIHVLSPAGENGWCAFATRQIGQGSIDLTHRFALPKREFLGPTTLTPEFSIMMANLALAKKGSFVIDPFAGSGGGLVAASHFGATMLGLDIDWRMVHGGVQYKTFDQYELSRPEFLRADFSREGRCFREDDICKHLFDAILCDPPYGIRAGARKIGQKDASRKPILDEHRATHIPQTRKYEGDEVIRDLLDAAAIMLRPGGRLVFLHPVPTPVWREKGKESLPTHPELKLLHAAEQMLRASMSRVLVTMERLPLESATSGAESSKRSKIL